MEMEPENIRAGPIVLVTIVLLNDNQFGSDKSPIIITYYHIHHGVTLATYFVRLQPVSRSEYAAAAHLIEELVNSKRRMTNNKLIALDPALWHSTVPTELFILQDPSDLSYFVRLQLMPRHQCMVAAHLNASLKFQKENIKGQIDLTG